MVDFLVWGPVFSIGKKFLGKFIEIEHIRSVIPVILRTILSILFFLKTLMRVDVILFILGKGGFISLFNKEKEQFYIDFLMTNS